MTDLLSLGADVEWPDHDRAAAVRELLGDTASLGRLAPLAEWIAGVHPRGANEQFRSVRAVVIGGRPGTAATEAAEAAGVGLRVVDDLGETADALQAGIALADDEADQGTELLIVAAPQLRADAALAVAVLTNTEPVKVLSRGAAATDPEAWMELAVEVRDGRRRALPHRDNADALLTAIDSPRLAALAGLILRAAIRRTPVLLDGPVACAAALVAYEAQPRAVRWWCAADLGPDPVHDLALTRLGQQELLGLGTGLGDGLAGVLALPLLQAAARLAS